MVLTKWHQLILKTAIVNLRQEMLKNFILQNQQKRSISITNTIFLPTKHYDTLGLSPSATHSDIKAAYYKLSKLYHPDKNKDSEFAIHKFRDIAEAYEVLGNMRLRKLYDKGIFHTAGSQYGKPAYENIEKDEEDDPQTKFYKAHMKKSKVPSSGRTPIYDFDEWSRAHYGASFQRSQTARSRYDRYEERRRDDDKHYQKEVFIFGLLVLITGFFTCMASETNYDNTPTKTDEKNIDEKKS